MLYELGRWHWISAKHIYDIEYMLYSYDIGVMQMDKEILERMPEWYRILMKAVDEYREKKGMAK